MVGGQVFLFFSSQNGLIGRAGVASASAGILGVAAVFGGLTMAGTFLDEVPFGFFDPEVAVACLFSGFPDPDSKVFPAGVAVQISHCG
jgi:hypothetical protein